MHAGESIQVRLTAARDGKPVTAGTVVAEFWAPGRDPEHDPDARRHPDHRFLCLYDDRTRRWTTQVDGRITAGWAPGQWTVRGKVSGEHEGWAWQVLPLAA